MQKPKQQWIGLSSGIKSNGLIPMTESDIFWTFQTALSHGGGFYHALAAAGIKADPANKRRLLNAFPELRASYGPTSRIHKRLREGVSA